MTALFKVFGSLVEPSNFCITFTPFINTIRKKVFLKLFYQDWVGFSFPTGTDLKGKLTWEDTSMLDWR